LVGIPKFVDGGDVVRGELLIEIGVGFHEWGAIADEAKISRYFVQKGSRQKLAEFSRVRVRRRHGSLIGVKTV
jgi:hypothetical protein